MVVKNHGETVADIPAKKLADEAPIYQRESRDPEYLKAVRAFKLDTVPDTTGRPGNLEDSARLARRSPRRTGFTASTTTWCATAPWFAPGRMPP